MNLCAASRGETPVGDRRRSACTEVCLAVIFLHTQRCRRASGLREEEMHGAPQREHAEKIQSALLANDAARSALVASWSRSATLHRLDPSNRRPPRRMADGEFRLARQRLEVLIRAAQASLDRLYLAVGGVGCCAML